MTHQLVFRHTPRMIIMLCTLMSFFSSTAQSHYSHDRLDIKDYTITSKVLNEERKIRIYKPPVHPEYANAVSPVIYVLDGEYYSDLVSVMISFNCERFVTMPPITVVAIENIGEGLTGRQRDLTPLIAKDSSFYKTSGGAEKFLQFIREEVFPFVEKDHKKTPYRILVGHSLAGFLTMHAFLQHAEMFNAYLASSPAMHMDNSAYLKIAEETIKAAANRNNRLFFSVANERRPYLTNVKKIDSLLQSKKPTGLSYQFQYYPKETHTTVFLKSFYDGLHYILRMDPPGGGLPTAAITWNMFEDHYYQLSELFGYSMKPEENFINDIAYDLLYVEKNVDKALEFFKKNLENYPNSANVYDSYAEALLVKGDKKNAIINYEKAFQMDPTNTAAREIIEKLKKEKF